MKKKQYTSSDWYHRSYVSHELINSALVEVLKEKQIKVDSDTFDSVELEKRLEDILNDRDNYKNFQSIEKMDLLIEKYRTKR